VLSAITGTTTVGLPLSLGLVCCSTEAKYEFISTKSHLSDRSPIT
jgi:hypothetical protein